MIESILRSRDFLVVSVQQYSTCAKRGRRKRGTRIDFVCDVNGCYIPLLQRWRFLKYRLRGGRVLVGFIQATLHSVGTQIGLRIDNVTYGGVLTGRCWWWRLACTAVICCYLLITSVADEYRGCPCCRQYDSEKLLFCGVHCLTCVKY